MPPPKKGEKGGGYEIWKRWLSLGQQGGAKITQCQSFWAQTAPFTIHFSSRLHASIRRPNDGLDPLTGMDDFLLNAKLVAVMLCVEISHCCVLRREENR